MTRLITLAIALVVFVGLLPATSSFAAATSSGDTRAPDAAAAGSPAVPPDDCSRRGLARMRDGYEIREGKVRSVNYEVLARAVTAHAESMELLPLDTKAGQPGFTRRSMNACGLGIDAFRIHTPPGPGQKWALALAIPKGAYRYHRVFSMKGTAWEHLLKYSDFVLLDVLPAEGHARRGWPEGYEVWVFDPTRTWRVPMEADSDYVVSLLWTQETPFEAWASVLLLDDFLPVNAAPSSALRHALWASAFGLSNAGPEEGRLLQALFLENLEEIRGVAAAGETLKAFWKDHGTALPFVVTEAANAPLLAFLLDQGFNFDVGFVPDYENRMWLPHQVGRKPIDFALAKGMHEAVNLLLAKGCRLPDDGIILAAGSKNLPLVAALLEKGVDVNAMTPKGLTPLRAAMQKDDIEMVKLLVDKGADVKASTDILGDAIMNQNLEAVRLLVARGADVNARNWSGRRMIFLAAIHAEGDWRKNLDMVKILVGHGADVHVKDDKGKTVLEAVQGEHREGAESIAEFLQTVP